jgi:hypothetical protein
MVEVCEVSPEMKEQKNFLFIISGGTCSKQFAVSSNSILFHCQSIVLSLTIKEVFSAINNCVLSL